MPSKDQSDLYMLPMNERIFSILEKLSEDIYQIKLRLERGDAAIESLPEIRDRLKKLEDALQQAAIREAVTATQLRIVWWFSAAAGTGAIGGLVSILWTFIKHAP